MTRKVLGTGLTGTIGRHLVGRVEPVDVRLERDFSIDEAEIEGASLIHLAAIVGESKVRANLQVARTINVDATGRLAKMALESRVRRFIYVSTSHVYDLSANHDLLSERHPTLPRGQYSLQKLLAESLVKEVFQSEPERLVIARVFSVIDDDQPEGTLGYALRQVSLDPSQILHFVDDVRDFLTPRIVADVLYRIASCDSVSGVLNICTGRALSIRDVATLLIPSETLGDVTPRMTSGRSLVPRIVGDPSLLNTALNLKADSLFQNFCQQVRGRLRV